MSKTRTFSQHTADEESLLLVLFPEAIPMHYAAIFQFWLRKRNQHTWFTQQWLNWIGNNTKERLSEEVEMLTNKWQLNRGWKADETKHETKYDCGRGFVSGVVLGIVLLARANMPYYCTIKWTSTLFRNSIYLSCCHLPVFYFSCFDRSPLVNLAGN